MRWGGRIGGQGGKQGNGGDGKGRGAEGKGGEGKGGEEVNGQQIVKALTALITHAPYKRLKRLLM